MADIGPAELVAGIALVALTAYVLLGGADFGGGVWDLLASGPRKREQRALIAEAIGPIWEANHVWLILVIVVLFTCFPVAFAGRTRARPARASTGAASSPARAWPRR